MEHRIWNMEEMNDEMTNGVAENNATVVDEKGFVVVDAPTTVSEEEKAPKDKTSVMHWIVEGVLLVAVIVLYILHFCCGNAGKKTAVVAKPAEKGTGEVVFINIDTINEHYELVKILTDSIDSEKQKQAVVFQNRQKALEQKAANFEKNYSSGSLTPQQAQYAQQSLQEESTRLQNDYAQAVESLEARYTAALTQMADSLNAAAQRINAAHNASYIFSYQSGGQLLYADPAHDITNEVLDELNRSFKKKK